MEISANSASAYQAAKVQQQHATVAAKTVKESVEFQGAMALQLLNGATSVPPVDPAASIGTKIDLYV